MWHEDKEVSSEPTTVAFGRCGDMYISVLLCGIITKMIY